MRCAMAVPDYQTPMLPLLRYAADGKDHTLKESEEALAGQFSLTPVERDELLPSGQQVVFMNRPGCARTCMKKAGLQDAPKRGVFRITQRCLDVLAKSPARVGVTFLEQFPAFITFRDTSRPASVAAVTLDNAPSRATALRCTRLSAARHADRGVAGGVNENSLNGAGHPTVGMARRVVSQSWRDS